MPVTVDTLSDLQDFSACHGKFAYCSCMRWRMKSSEFMKSYKEYRAQKLAALVKAKDPVGILAYQGDDVIAWCSVAPRQSYGALESYKALPRIDAEDVWSIACFFVDRRCRRSGMMLALLQAAVDYAARQGAKIIEGYPVEPDAPSYTYMGSPATFLKAGFSDVTPVDQSRRVMRRHIN